jgi:hypothetical protein
MYNSHHDLFQIRDVINNLAVGGFKTWDDAIEWCYKFHTDRLHDDPVGDPAGSMDVMDDAGGYTP